MTSTASAGYDFHRPVRTWPRQVRRAPIQLPAPPAAPVNAPGGRWSRLLPLAGSVAMVGFAFVVHSLIYLIVIGLMVVSMVAATLVTSFLSGREDRRRWARTRQRYLEMAGSAEQEAGRSAAVQRAALEGLYPETAGLAAQVSARDGIWERRPDDPDFGTVRLGTGVVPAARPVTVEDTSGSIETGDAELATAAQAAAKATATLDEAPVTVPLGALGVIAVVGEPDATRALAGAWLASLAVNHAPGELRFAGWFPAEAVAVWDWTKWLPHCRDVDTATGFGRARRSVSADLASFADQISTLVRTRLERREVASGADGSAGPGSTGLEHVVVLVDGWAPGTPLAGLPGLEAVMARAAAVSVTVVALVASPDEVPSACGAVVHIDREGRARYLESGLGGRLETGVVADRLDLTVAAALARRLAPLHLEAGSRGAAWGDNVRLVELLGAEDAARVLVDRRPLDAAAVTAGAGAALLRVPIGRGDDGATLELDLKEAAAGGMGPHGILVGATGSGKSELLRSLAAGLAAGHETDLVNLLLIDFKGGAAFAGLGDLPHVAGLVTNLADEPDLIARVRLALVGELERRQRLLASSGDLDSIRDYHRAMRTRDLPPLPYLVVVVDEFGELLAAEPDFIEVFNAIGRLGRSLGLHLLLATQRLDEGRVRTLEPHLRYRLGLRTYTAGESRSILGSAVAYELPPVPGLGYLSADGRLSRFKAAITTLPYRPEAEQDPAATQALRPFTLQPGWAPSAATVEAGGDGPTELDVVVAAVAAGTTGRAATIWLPTLPDRLTLGALRARFGSPTVSSGAGGAALSGPAEGAADRDQPVVLGLLDLPASQAQVPLLWDVGGAGGNLGIAGAPRTGKSSLLATLVLSLAEDHGPHEVQFYCLDLGGGSLFALRDLAHMAAVVSPGEPESAVRLVQEVQALIDERAQRARGGPSGGPEPAIILVVDNVGLVRQVLPDLEPELARLATTGLHYGVHVVVSANRWWDIRPQLLDALGTKLEFRLGDPGETVGDRVAARQLPVNKPGRGLTRAGEMFQAALASRSPESSPGSEPAAIAAAVAVLNERTDGRRAPRLVALPDRVRETDLPSLADAAGGSGTDGGCGWLLGVSQFRARPLRLDLLAPGSHLVVYGDAGSGRTTLLDRALRHLSGLGPAQVRLHVVDPSRHLLDLADLPGVEDFAVTAGATEKLALGLAETLARRLPAEGATLAELRRAERTDWVHHMLVVDDYELLVGPMGSPLSPLLDVLGQSTHLGLHVVLARRVAGVQRSAFEPFAQRLRELRPTTLILSGSRDEGPIVEGIYARPGPPGRATLVSPNGPAQVVQCCLPPEDSTS